MNSRSSTEALDRGFVAFAAAVALAAIGLRLWVSAHEWFMNDDFYFLHFIESSRWSWQEVFLPTEARIIGAYRPLGLEAYVMAGFQLFGWHAFGYYVLGLLVQLATAAVAYRIAGQLGLGRRAAAVASLLVVAAPQAITATYAVNVHNYLLGGLMFALATSFSLDAVRQRPHAQWFACVALLLGMLCNDVCLVLPAIVLVAAINEYGMALELERWRKTLRAVLPSVVVVALFLDFRTNGVPLRQDGWFYEIDLGLDMLSNTRGNLALLAGGWVHALVLSGVTLAMVAFAMTQRERARQAVRERKDALLLSAAWLAAGLFPFAVLALPHPRFTLALLTPAALLLAALLEAALALVPDPRRGLLVAVALVGAALPWGRALERARHPEGAVHRDSFAVLRHELAAGPEPEKVEVAYGAHGLAGAAQATRFRWQTFGGSLVRAARPGSEFDVELVDLSAGGAAAGPCAGGCRRLYLRDDLSVSATAPR